MISRFPIFFHSLLLCFSITNENFQAPCLVSLYNLDNQDKIIKKNKRVGIKRKGGEGISEMLSLMIIIITTACANLAPTSSKPPYLTAK